MGTEIPSYTVSPFYSLFNHSCDPNANAKDKAIFISSGDDMEATKDIKTGEEVCITYLDPFSQLKSKGERAEMLCCWLRGDCGCRRCGSGDDGFVGGPGWRVSMFRVC